MIDGNITVYIEDNNEYKKLTKDEVSKLEEGTQLTVVIINILATYK